MSVARTSERSRNRAARLVLLTLALAVVFVLSLLVGAVPLRPARVFRAFFGGDPADPAYALVTTIRLPRVALAALVGASLSISGALLQAFFQNPMAGPYVVGVSSGAGLAAVAAMSLGASSRIGPFDLVPAAAFAGGIAAVLLVYALARRIRFLQAEGLLLIGIAVGAVFSALTSMILIFGKGGAEAALFWMMGTFSTARWSAVAMTGILLAVCGAGSLLITRDLNVLLWGDETARSLGSPVRRVRFWALILSSVLAAGSVAACGVIGFVGLMVPHLARGFLGTSDHRFVVPASALIGALLVLLADALARAAFAPLELPVGAVTSALGAPFLVLLVVRRHRRLGGE